MQRNLYTYQRLKDYALWYYFRYYPSNKKLLQKLQEKGGKENSKKVFQDIQHLLQEKEIIAAKVDAYVFKNKNYRHIRQKMFEKGFPKESVESYLEKYTSSGESILDIDYLKRQVDIYARKGKSKRYIYQKFSETPEDKEIITHILDEYFIDGEGENIQILYEKIKDKYPKDKIIQKLLEKGFLYEDIKKIVN